MKFEPHRFVPFGKKTKLPWIYCQKCGLIALKNPKSDKAVKSSCENS